MSFIEDPVLLATAAIAGAILIFLAIRRWQQMILGVFVLLVFEGALRKWALPSAQAEIYFLKDLLLVLAYIGFVIQRPASRSVLQDERPITIVLVFVFIYSLMEVFNPNSPSVLIGLIGLKAYFLYAPLAFILPYAIKSRTHLFWLIWCYLLLAIPVAILGFIQVAAGPESGLNTYVSHTEGESLLAQFGASYELVRTSGTFSYITGYTTFLTVIALLAIGFNSAQGWRLKNNLVPVTALVLVVGAMFTTGSRTTFYSLFATAPLFLILGLRAGVLTTNVAVRLCALLPLIVFAAMNLSPEAVQAFSHRASHADDPVERLLGPMTQAIEAISNAPIFGMGIGVTHNSALSVMGALELWWLDANLVFEGETARVAVELGAIGFVLVYALRIVIVAFALRCVFSYKDQAYRCLGIAMVANLSLGLIVPVVNNVTAGLYYWGSLGLLLCMRRLERDVGWREELLGTPDQTRHATVLSGQRALSHYQDPASTKRHGLFR